MGTFRSIIYGYSYLRTKPSLSLFRSHTHCPTYDSHHQFPGLVVDASEQGVVHDGVLGQELGVLLYGSHQNCLRVRVHTHTAPPMIPHQFPGLVVDASEQGVVHDGVLGQELGVLLYGSHQNCLRVRVHTHTAPPMIPTTSSGPGTGRPPVWLSSELPSSEGAHTLPIIVPPPYMYHT